MKSKYPLYGYLIALAFLLIPAPSFAVSAVATINATIARFLSITNVSSLEFGVVSVSAVAGSVIVDSNGMRLSSGGVTINPSGLVNPAKFIIEGKPDSSFSIVLPNKVELRDGNGNTILVNNFETRHQAGNLDSNGALEVRVGGKINLEANQKSGDYSGVMIVELNYS